MNEREREQRDQRDATTTGAPDGRDPRETREAQEAHGGSMAPGLVDDTGHPVAEPSALGAPGEDGTGS